MKPVTPFVYSIMLLVTLLIISGIVQFYFQEKKAAPSFLSNDGVVSFLERYPKETGFLIGDGSMAITAVVFFDPSFDQTALKEALADISDNQIRAQRVKLYVKPMIFGSDLGQNTQRERFARSFYCLLEQMKDNMAFDAFLDEVSSRVAAHYEASPFVETCLQTLSLTPYALENERLGLEGYDARVYIGIINSYDILEGIPTQDRFERVLRFQEITLGK